MCTQPGPRRIQQFKMVNPGLLNSQLIKFMKLKQIVKYLAVAFAGLVAPILAFAQANQVQNGLSGIQQSFGFSSPLTGATTASQLAIQIINLMLMFSGIVAVFFIIIGGYQYLTAGGNSEQAEKGRTAVTNAIIGIVIIILSYVIINVIVNLVGNGLA